MAVKNISKNHLIFEVFPWLRKWVDWEANKEGLEDLSCRSKYRISLRCPVCGYRLKYTVSMLKELVHNLECRRCNSLGIKRPDLLKYWDYKANMLDPFIISPGSHKTANWKCEKCGYSWTKIIRYMSSFTYCPRCEFPGHHSNLFVNSGSENIRLWDLENNNIDIGSVTKRNKDKRYWRCPDCNHRWGASISTMCLLPGCPYCKGLSKRISRLGNKTNNSLAFCFPDIAEEFLSEENGITPDRVSKYSNKKYMWRCRVCGGKWESFVYNRIRNHGCPYCNNQLPTETNNLAVLKPELLLEFSSKNNKRPEEYMAHTNKKVWWECPVCDFEYLMRVHDKTRIDGKACGCPRCAIGIHVSKSGATWLDSLNISKEYREKKIYYQEGTLKFYRVDALVGNTVYEFLGDFWHGNPSIYAENRPNKKLGVSFGELYGEWLKRKEILENLGYMVVYVWESDFKKGQEL